MAGLVQDFYEDDEEIVEDKKKKTTGDLMSSGVSGGTGIGEGGDTKGPTGFVNLEQYLEQNKPETQEMVSGLTEDLGQRTQAFTGQLGKAEEQFKEKVDLGGVGYDKKLAEQFYKDPTQFDKKTDADQLEKFKQMRDAQYKGPQQLSQAQDIYKPLIQSQEDLLSRAELMRKRSGQESLLNERSQTPITAGQMALNRALIGSTPLGVSAIETSAQQAETAAKDLENRRKALNEIAQRRQQETQETAGQIQTGLTGARKNLRDTITERIRGLREGAEVSQTEFKEALGRPTGEALDSGELQAIERAGLSQEQFDRLRGLEAYIEDPYRDIGYKEINLAPETIPDSSGYFAGKEGQELQGKIRYIDGKPVLDTVPENVREQVEKLLQEQDLQTYREDLEGRDFDPNLLFQLERPDVAFREGTVTTPEEYENLKALRELQQLETPLGYQLEDRPELFGVVPQVSGEKTLDEILDSLAKERELYEAEGLRRFTERNPFISKVHSRRKKQGQGHVQPTRPTGYGSNINTRDIGVGGMGTYNPNTGAGGF